MLHANRGQSDHLQIQCIGPCVCRSADAWFRDGSSPAGALAVLAERRRGLGLSARRLQSMGPRGSLLWVSSSGHLSSGMLCLIEFDRNRSGCAVGATPSSSPPTASPAQTVRTTVTPAAMGPGYITGEGASAGSVIGGLIGALLGLVSQAATSTAELTYSRGRTFADPLVRVVAVLDGQAETQRGKAQTRRL